MTIDEMIAVLQAVKAGQQIEFRSLMGQQPWQGFGFGDRFQFGYNEYRVKPEPREWMAVPVDLDRLNDIAPCKVGAIKVREVLE